MQVEYDVTPEDYVRFNKYHLDHSPSWRRTRISCAAVILAAFICPGVLSYARWHDPVSLIGVVVAGSIAAFFMDRYLWWSTARRIRKMLSEGKAPLSVERCTIEISPEGLRADGTKGQASLKWSAVDKVALGPTHAYVYVGPLNALMVPHSAFSSVEERDRFLGEMERYRNAPPAIAAASA